jgi:hypothetical protein
LKLLDSLERKLGRFAVSNVTLYLVVGQTVLYVMQAVGASAVGSKAALIPALVLKGEVWRLFTFIFQPPASSPIFIFFALYFFYMMGTALEHYWGAFRYNVFLLIGYAATVAVSFLTPGSPASVTFIGGSVFLAFAAVNPEFQILLFFILPVRIKWLALLTWIGYGYTVLTGSWSSRFLIAASLLNFFIFFGRDILFRMKSGKARMERAAKAMAEKDRPMHTCVVCGATDKSHPEKSFRYCGECAGTACYCMEHLAGHAHIRAADSGAADSQV